MNLETSGLKTDPTAKPSPVFFLLTACFFLSGFAGLIYESAWTQHFSLVFGTTELAVATVLAAYMAGLAIGAAAAGRLEARVRRPVLGYALLELGIGLAAMAVPAAIRGAGALQAWLFRAPDLPDGFTPGLLVFDLIASMVILLVPTSMMGATLPLLARHAVRGDGDVGPRVGLLYAANTLGAAGGTLGAAFVFLPAWGLGVTLWIAIALNVLVFVAAAGLSKLAPAPVPHEPPFGNREKYRAPSWILLLVTLSGMVALTHEVLWTRLLAHILGGSVYAFGAMLATFLLGLALGAGLAARWTRSRKSARRCLILAQLGVAVFTVTAFSLVDRLPALARDLNSDAHFGFWPALLLSGISLMPCALCFGATFPCAVKLAAGGSFAAARASSQVFAWNTVGAIAGSLLAGFILIPVLGFAQTTLAAACAGLFLAVIAAWFGLGKADPRSEIGEGDGNTGRRDLGWVGIAVLVCLAYLVIRPPRTPWNVLRTSPMTKQTTTEEVIFLETGRNATVALTELGTDWRLSVNGLPESVIQAPGSRINQYKVARWLSMLPLAARPELRSMLVIGFGAGLTVESLPPSVALAQVVELESAVVDANEHLAGQRARDPLADPRVKLHIDDARGALLLADRTYDAIVSQPSHPWTVGASNLFTEEFFRLVQARLGQNGVFVQWIGLQFVDEPLLRSLLATLSSVFPHVEVYAPGRRNALLFLASEAPLFDEARLRRSLEREPEHWHSLGIFRPEDFLVELELSDEGCRRLGKGAAVNRDLRNLLQLFSPKAMTHPISPKELDTLFKMADPLPRWVADYDGAYLVRRMIENNQLARAGRVAQAIADPVAKLVALGSVALATGRGKQGIGMLTRALQMSPGHAEAEACLLRFFRKRIQMEAVPDVLKALMSDRARAMELGWQLERTGRWQELKAIEDSLRIDEPSHPLYRETIRLRVGWRLAVGDPATVREALALTESILCQTGQLEDLLLRARAAARCGDHGVALSLLFELTRLYGRKSMQPSQLILKQGASEALEIVDLLPPGSPRQETLRNRIRARFLNASNDPTRGIDDFEE